MRIKDIYYNTKHFVERIIRTIEYVPCIWKNEDWEYTYIYRLLSYKLKRVEKCLEKDSYHAHSKRYSKQVKICRIILERLERDEYCEYEKLKHDLRWGDLKCRDGKRSDSGVELIIYREKCNTKEEKALEEKEFKWLLDREKVIRN